MEDLSEYLKETDCIDYKNPLVAEKANELKASSSDRLDYIEKAYNFVRDKIPHTWDAKLTVVSKNASDVLKTKTGIFILFVRSYDLVFPKLACFRINTLHFYMMGFFEV